MDDAGINAFVEFREPRRVPIHSTTTQLCAGTSETMFAKARDTFPVRVITDNVFGALRADSTDTRGDVATMRSVREDTREAVRDNATYRPPKSNTPTSENMLIVRRGFADWRDRAPKPLLARDTCVNRISIEVS